VSVVAQHVIADSRRRMSLLSIKM